MATPRTAKLTAPSPSSVNLVAQMVAMESSAELLRTEAQRLLIELRDLGQQIRGTPHGSDTWAQLTKLAQEKGSRIKAVDDEMASTSQMYCSLLKSNPGAVLWRQLGSAAELHPTRRILRSTEMPASRPSRTAAAGPRLSQALHPAAAQQQDRQRQSASPSPAAPAAPAAQQRQSASVAPAVPAAAVVHPVDVVHKQGSEVAAHSRKSSVKFTSVPEPIDVTATEAVDKLGFGVSLPPGRLFAKNVVSGAWAASVGMKDGDEVISLNDELVETMSADQFKSTMRSRPLKLRFLSL
eukprot:gnl/TRDRNA2_/TRDRNA2_40167_c0_seq1.p1 gnl/TRDRNA2_/TRDRNA2_40167_c0~~gnl/TRDRNA2_/TRDRNA2_40167_c0_seq1.p1  ORF type:complete len:315 (+),score=47.31 gnl/TRDRNA2_/TRDRNA2_40167_c0_seq1:63-947(+)